MELKTIELEVISKNIIVTKVDENGFIQKQGFSPLNIEDWDYLDMEEELNPYKEFMWDGLGRPELKNI